MPRFPRNGDIANRTLVRRDVNPSARSWAGKGGRGRNFAAGNQRRQSPNQQAIQPVRFLWCDLESDLESKKSRRQI